MSAIDEVEALDAALAAYSRMVYDGMSAVNDACLRLQGEIQAWASKGAKSKLDAAVETFRTAAAGLVEAKAATSEDVVKEYVDTLRGAAGG